MELEQSTTVSEIKGLVQYSNHLKKTGAYKGCDKHGDKDEDNSPNNVHDVNIYLPWNEISNHLVYYFICPRYKNQNMIVGFELLVAERTSYFCLVRKLIWLLWSSHIFTQWGWLILFSPDHFPGQHKNGESPPNYLFLRTFREGQTYFLSAPFIAAESQHHEESCLIYRPFESTLLDQGFPVEHELYARNPLLTGTPLCRL